MKKDLILFIFSVALVAACQNSGNPGGQSAATTATPSSGPVPSASYDPSWTDLGRVNRNTIAPDFVLEDQTGKMHRLADYRGKKNVVLVFYRGYF
ncbi:MAG: hypothetical protein ACREEM_50250 [Blastocatellia bacterium]